MLISDRYRVVFIHNPKCGGTSLRDRLKPLDDRDNFYWLRQDNPHLNRRIDKAHVALEDFQRGFPEEFPNLEQYFCFTFVRDPYERFISAFNEKFRLYVPESDADNYAEYRQKLNEFCVTEATAQAVRFKMGFQHFIPQHHFTHIGLKAVADFVGRMENFEADFQRIAALAKFPAEVAQADRVSNVRTRAARLEPWRLLDPASIEHLNMLYARDFLQFGYVQLNPRASSLKQRRSWKFWKR